MKLRPETHAFSCVTDTAIFAKVSDVTNGILTMLSDGGGVILRLNASNENKDISPRICYNVAHKNLKTGAIVDNGEEFTHDPENAANSMRTFIARFSKEPELAIRLAGYVTDGSKLLFSFSAQAVDKGWAVIINDYIDHS